MQVTEAFKRLQDVVRVGADRALAWSARAVAQWSRVLYSLIFPFCKMASRWLCGK